MIIGIHANELDGRGCGHSCRAYALGLVKRGHSVVFLASSAYENALAGELAGIGSLAFYTQKPLPCGNVVVRRSISRIVDRHHIDFLHCLSYGYDNGIVPDNCRTGVHCIFDMSEPHGDVYAGVSQYLCRKFGRDEGVCVPHIIEAMPPTEDWRKKHGIPKNATVFGRHGGRHEFNIPFAQEAVTQALKERDDIYFFFLSTSEFIQHERVIFIPWVETKQDIFNFIHACDAMLHARSIGETFGLAIGEFSAAGKSILTWDGGDDPGYDKAHLDHLGDKAVLYHDYDELLNIFRSAVPNGEYVDCFSDRFSEKNVMDAYEQVFLKTVNAEPKKQYSPAAVSAGDDLSDLFDQYGSDKGRRYHNYGRIYEFLLEKYQNRPITLLEIGVYEGGSMKAWLDYLPQAQVIGVDLGGDFDPKDARAIIRIGDQANPEFLATLIDKDGPFDVIIDDGSHQSQHQQVTFEHLWPALKSGGVYVIEDVEVSYKPEFNQGDRIPTTEYFKAKATAESIKVGQAEQWVLFAGELIAVFKK